MDNKQNSVNLTLMCAFLTFNVLQLFFYCHYGNVLSEEVRTQTKFKILINWSTWVKDFIDLKTSHRNINITLRLPELEINGSYILLRLVWFYLWLPRCGRFTYEARLNAPQEFIYNYGNSQTTSNYNNGGEDSFDIRFIYFRSVNTYLKAIKNVKIIYRYRSPKRHTMHSPFSEILTLRWLFFF